jgi:hypothetical protein
MICVIISILFYGILIRATEEHPVERPVEGLIIQQPAHVFRIGDKSIPQDIFAETRRFYNRVFIHHSNTGAGTALDTVLELIDRNMRQSQVPIAHEFSRQFLLFTRRDFPALLEQAKRSVIPLPQQETLSQSVNTTLAVVFEKLEHNQALFDFFIQDLIDFLQADNRTPHPEEYTEFTQYVITLLQNRLRV